MTEEFLDNLMETCLTNKYYQIMDEQLEAVKGTYSKYDFYRKKLDEAKEQQKNKKI